MLKRAPVLFFILVAFIVVAGCGSTKSTVCPLAPSPSSSSTCSCTTTDAACPVFAPHLLANGVNGVISVFPVDPGSGALGTAVTTTGPTLSLGMTTLANTFVYVSNPDVEIGGSVDAWSIDLSTGTLTAVPGSPFTLGALSYGVGLAADNAGPFLYVADTNKIDGFKIDGQGALTAVPNSPFTSGANLFLTIDPQGRFVFSSVVDPPGSVSAFTVDAGTGTLTEVAGSPFPAVQNSTLNSQPAEIVVDSSGSFVYVPLSGINSVAAFSIGTNGVLTPVPGSPFQAGSMPFAVTTVNNFLYVCNHADGTISGYSINPQTGVLSPLAGSPFAVPVAALTTDSTGHFLYGSGASGIRVFAIDANTGGLSEISGSPFAAPGASVLSYVL